MKPMELRPTGLFIGFAQLVNAGLLADTPPALSSYFDSVVVIEDMQRELIEKDPTGSITRRLTEYHRRYRTQ